MLKKSLLIIFGAAMLHSCYSDIDFGNLMPDPKPVINAVANPDTIVMASVSRTYRNDEDLDKLQLKDADVSLYVNGEFHEKMVGKEFEYHSNTSSPGSSEELRKHKYAYFSTYVPKQGDHIKVEATTNYGMASVEDIVPERVAIESVNPVISRITSTIYGDEEVTGVNYKIQFTDPAGKANYYMVNIINPEQSALLHNVPFKMTDPIFALQNQDMTEMGDDNNTSQWGAIFTDETIDGKTYELSLQEEIMDSYINDGGVRDIMLYSISEDYYKYLRSVIKDQKRDESSMGKFGFYEPIMIFNKVEGGVGFMGALNRSTKTVDLNLK